MDTVTTFYHGWYSGENMVKKKFTLFVLLACMFMFPGCEAGPPSGPTISIADSMAVNGLLHPNAEEQMIFLSQWYQCSQNSTQPECPSANYYDWSIVGAEVSLISGENSWTAKEEPIDSLSIKYRREYLSSYNLTMPGVKPGQKFTLRVSHPDYQDVTAETIIPDSVIFEEEPCDTLIPNIPELTFSWSNAENTAGYLPVLYFVGETDSCYAYQQLYSDYNIQEKSFGEPQPDEASQTTYIAEDLLEQIRYFRHQHSDRWGDINNFDIYYVTLQVYSMSPSLFQTRQYGEQPDPVSSFNAPVNIYSNITNGGGTFGSYWITLSKKIVVLKSLL